MGDQADAVLQRVTGLRVLALEFYSDFEGYTSETVETRTTVETQT